MAQTSTGKAWMIDPETGLELSEIVPAPASRSVNAFGGPAPAFSPAASQPIASTRVPELITIDGGNTTSQRAGLRESSLLDKALFTVFGTPDSMLDDEAHKGKHKRRDEAAGIAEGMATSPGKAFMGIPDVGGSSSGESFDKILQGLASIFGGKA